MESQISPKNSTMSQFEPTQGMQPNGKKKFTKMQWIILAVCILVVLCVVIIKVIMVHGGGHTVTQDDPKIYYAREGYSKKQLGDAIGDPLALDMSKHAPPLLASDGKNSIVYACNILSIDDLRQQKVYLAARADTKAVTRGFLDRTGKAGVNLNLYSLPGAARVDDNNVCQYDLQPGDILNIAVYQPPYTSIDAVNNTIAARYTKVNPIAGLPTYKEKGQTASAGYLIVSGDSAIEFLLNGNNVSANTQEKLLAIAVKNLADQEKNPVGLSIPQFKSPTYTQKYARACDFISNDDVKSLTGTDASVFTTESLPSGTGVAQVDKKLYNSLSTECARFNTGLGTGLTAGPFDQKLDVTITSFNADIPAKKYMEMNQKAAATQVMAPIGDQGYGYRDDSNQNSLRFRQGRFVVEILFDSTVQSNAGLQDTATMTQKLTPYARQVAEKLKSIQ